MSIDISPQWTTELRKATEGLDHLGLGSVASGQILTRLVPGINVLTPHPRYHAFYAFILDEFWRRDDLPRERATWRDYFRARAFVLSVAANSCDHPDFDGSFGGVTGSAKTAAMAAHPPDKGYNVDYNYIDEPLGGYGLYYRTVMASLGLIYPAPKSGYPIDVPTETGKELAAGFRESIGGTSYWTGYFDAPTVPADAVAEYGLAACPCRLRLETSSDRETVRRVMLYGGAKSHASARRASLRMLTDIAHAVNGPISEDDFRQLVYFKETTSGGHWEPSELPTTDDQWTIPETRRGWRAYQTREFYTFALNALWAWLVDWGIEHGGVGRPLKANAAVQALIEDLDFNVLAQALGASPIELSKESPISTAERRLRLAAGEPEIVPSVDQSWIDRPYSLEAPLSEWKLYEVAHSADPSTKATAAFALLLLIAARVDPESMATQSEWAFAALGSRGRLPMQLFHEDLSRHRSREASISEYAEWLLRFNVIGQHLRVAGSKLPFDTYRFVREGDRLRFIDKPRPIGFNDSRFNAMAFTLADLGLALPLGLDHHPLDQAGHQFRETGHLQEPEK